MSAVPPEAWPTATPGTEAAADCLARLRAEPPSAPVRILNVCGGHERVLARAGLRAVLPPGLVLVPGPGCPVCVCPEDDIRAAIALALDGVTLVAFGDLLRVPVDAPRGAPGSLAAARAAGADVRVIASPLDAARIAAADPGRPVVFLAAGFETTMAPVAALLAAGVPANLSLLLAGRRTWPIVARLLADDAGACDALVAPGHVATVMGPEEWDFVATRHGLPVAVAGFSPASLLAAIAAVVAQRAAGVARVDNCYPEAVRPGGNARARALLDTVFAIADADWRGIGTVPASGYALRADWAAHDARRVHGARALPPRRRPGDMPPGCDCARVVLGRIPPDACALYGTACTPARPIGPCMVSDEGACHIWWTAGRRRADAALP